MIHSIKELNDIMPGEWKNYLNNNPEPHAALSNQPYVFIYYFYNGYQNNPTNKWWIFTSINSGEFVSINQALKFYKKHFALSNFK